MARPEREEQREMEAQRVCAHRQDAVVVRPAEPGAPESPAPACERVIGPVVLGKRCPSTDAGQEGAHCNPEENEEPKERGCERIDVHKMLLASDLHAGPGADPGAGVASDSADRQPSASRRSSAALATVSARELHASLLHPPEVGSAVHLEFLAG